MEFGKTVVIETRIFPKASCPVYGRLVWRHLQKEALVKQSDDTRLVSSQWQPNENFVCDDRAASKVAMRPVPGGVSLAGSGARRETTASV